MANDIESRIQLVKVLNDLRSAPPMGAIGLIEFRNIVFGILPEIASYRDTELDDVLSNYVNEIMEKGPEQEWENPPLKPPNPGNHR